MLAPFVLPIPVLMGKNSIAGILTYIHSLSQLYIVYIVLPLKQQFECICSCQKLMLTFTDNFEREGFKLMHESGIMLGQGITGSLIMHTNNFHTSNGNKLGCWEASAYQPTGMAKIAATSHNYSS